MCIRDRPFSSLDIPGFMHPTATGHAMQAPLLVESVLASRTGG